MDELRATFRIIGPELDFTEVFVPADGLRIGRIADADDPGRLVLPERQMSRLHSRLVWQDNALYVEDLKSSNGTWLNDAKIPANEPQLLKVGDSIRLGPYVLTLESIDAPSAAAPAPEPEPPAAIEAPPEPEPPVQEAPPAPPPEPSPPEKKSRAEKKPAKAAEPAAIVPQPEVPLPQPRLPSALDRVLPRLSSMIPVGQDDLAAIEKIFPRYDLSKNGENAKVQSTWLKYLPAIYADPALDPERFMGRYLLIFETVLVPIIWIIDHFDMFLSPDTAPEEWLRWLASWFDYLLVPELPIERQRAIVSQIGWLFLRRGTRLGMERLLELYFGVKPEIIESRDRECHFTVKLPLSDTSSPLRGDMADRLIMAQKPAFADYTLEIT